MEGADVPARFPLRWKIAGFAGGLCALAVAALAVFTVIVPWQEKLSAQEIAARALAGAVAPQIVEARRDGLHWDAQRVQRLVTNSSGSSGSGDVVYALVRDADGRLNLAASTANEKVLQLVAPGLGALYAREKDRVLEDLAAGGSRPGLRSVSLRIKDEERGRLLGWLELGLSTVAIDEEARASLFRDFGVLAATVALAWLGAVWIGGRIAGPLARLSLAMGRLQQGDFDARAGAAGSARDEVGDLARAFDAMAVGLKERERLRGTLDRYVSGAVADRILEEKNDLELRGELRRATVLFLDVRGFTTVSERLPPAEVLELLNDYFDAVVRCVAARGGTVNKFIGDAALCVWGAPRPAEAPEESAVLCALDIQRAARALSDLRGARGLTSVGFGIGINCGEVVAGNLGGAERLEYTVIGDAVNLAQRLESQAGVGEVLLSQSVYEKVEHLVWAVPHEPVRLKGKSQPVFLWELRGLKADATEAA